MRATLADASLARYAGRFVWLDLDYDKPANQAFLARHGATSFPLFFVLDPADEHATATQLGGMTLPELTNFLERGERGVLANSAAPADAALAKGDAALARGRGAEAADAYREALRLGGAAWPGRGRAVGSLTWTLMLNGQSQFCVETSTAEAPHLARDQEFSRVVLAGLMCLQGQSGPWAKSARAALEPLAAEAIAIPATLRDHRFQLYQQLMSDAAGRSDKATVERWGGLWLKELDATQPANDDERSALDIARVDAASLLDDPKRVLPALEASAQAMPDNYNASLRLAQMEDAAKQYDQALAACDRGLEHVTGPMGRSWLLQTKADAYWDAGRPEEARGALEEALKVAQEIGDPSMRDMNVMMISRKIQMIEKKGK
jgi:tetratricopeptide (TPR) repeat protein